jgi:hypothetical protein
VEVEKCLCTVVKQATGLGETKLRLKQSSSREHKSQEQMGGKTKKLNISNDIVRICIYFCLNEKNDKREVVGSIHWEVLTLADCILFKENAARAYL